MMLEEICRELNNWFDENPKDGTKNRFFGTFVISNGRIDLSGTSIQPGQYFRIVGSVFNDGVYINQTPEPEPEQTVPAENENTQSPDSTVSILTDETFDGAVWAMAVPPSVIALAAEIEEWQNKYGGADSAAMSPFNSESFGGYSYSKASRSGPSGSGDGNAGTWQGAFSNRLNQWRKARCLY